jgi:MFS family permease
MRGTAGFRAISRALAHRNFGIYIAGNSVSLIGTWMQRIGVGWLAWDLSHSGAVLGLVAFADLFPAMVMAPFGGALADRTDRLRVLFVGQCLIMLQALSLFVLTVTGLIDVGLLILLVLAAGLVIGFNQPARLALIPDLLPRSDLATAVAINSIVFNLARFIGPALAGMAIVWIGVEAVFAINGLTFIAFLVALTRLRLTREEAARTRRGGSMLGAVTEGLRYVARHPGIGPILLLQAVVTVSVRPFVELLPGFAEEVFARGAPGLAMLSSTIGLGAIVAGLWLSQRGGQGGLTRITLLSSVMIALATLGFSLSTWFPAALVCVALAGFGMVTAGVGTQTVLQIAVDEGMRGRVLSLFGLIFRGGPALGALVMGAASELVGLQAPLAAGALLGLVACGLLLRRRDAIARALAG